MIWDYLIVGAGSAGCVLAERLSADGKSRVLIVEAGPSDTHPYLHVPKGFGKSLTDPRFTWHFAVENGNGANEVWPRGKTLGGSSAVNGMMYVRGQPEDYEAWRAAGLTNWGWDRMERAFRALEGNGGRAGMRITTRPTENMPVCQALIEAGSQAGLPIRADLNEVPAEGIGYLPATIDRGRRWSAATAFLKPARRRSNLEIRTGVTITRIVFDGRRAIGAEGIWNGQPFSVRAKETILSAGAIQSPRLLQLSGIGDVALLRSLGIAPIMDRPGVGANLLEHRLLGLQYRIRSGGYNARLRGAGLALSAMQYGLTRRGPLSTGAYQVGAFVKVNPGSDRPDAELLMGPYSVDPAGKGMTMEKEPGLRVISFPLRPRSQGSVNIASSDPNVPPVIRPNYLSDPYDRDISIRAVRYIRALVEQPALRSVIIRELSPGPAVETDDDIIDAYRTRGVAGMHASSTCRMGTDDRAVVDADLRVRGVAGLSVMDCSVLPAMVSGNTNGPVMAMAWNAAEIIRQRG